MDQLLSSTFENGHLGVPADEDILTFLLPVRLEWAAKRDDRHRLAFAFQARHARFIDRIRPSGVLQHVGCHEDGARLCMRSQPGGEVYRIALYRIGPASGGTGVARED